MLSKYSLKLLAACLWSSTLILATNFTAYDYIVVGSGPGGGPLASRLAIAGYKVLLIEAGSDQGATDEESVPTLWPVSAQYNPMRWDYYINHYPNVTVQEQDSKFAWKTTTGDYIVGKPPSGSTPAGILYPRAGTLGGCGGHNALITILPHDNDWKYIETLTGDSSWSPGKMKGFFKKLERNEYLSNHASGHGQNGWLGTSVIDPSIVVKDSKVTAQIAAANAVLSKKPIGPAPSSVADLRKIQLQDVNGPSSQNSKEGVYQIPLAVSNGTRNSARDFILWTANAVNADGSRQYYLDVWLNTFVTKINFDQSGSTPRAIGVEYLSGVGLYGTTPKSYSQAASGYGSVTAAKEVIISAGTYDSPQLLKLSGVGPKAELAKWNISLVLDLPGVGGNLQDRYEMGIVSKTTSPFEVLKGCTLKSTDVDPCLEQWRAGTTPAEKGFYTGNAFQVGVVKKSSVADTDPDVFIFGGPVAFSGFYPGWADVGSLVPSSAPGWWSWVVLKAHVRNHAGTVTLRSADPLDPPVINFNGFEFGTTANGEDVKDLQAAYEGLQFVREANKVLAGIDKSFTEVFPGLNITAEADVKQFIKNEAFGHHATCTCAIGADGDPLAVLDSHFRVRGINGLRVVDASSFPKTPGFFPALPIYILSEKAADTILKDAKSS